MHVHLHNIQRIQHNEIELTARVNDAVFGLICRHIPKSMISEFQEELRLCSLSIVIEEVDLGEINCGFKRESM